MNEPFNDIAVPPRQSDAAVSHGFRLGVAFRYGLAVAYSMAGILILQVVLYYFPDEEPPLILLALGVTAAAFQGGFGPGFLATIIVTLGSWGFLIPPDGFAVPHPTQVMRLILIVAAGTSVSWLAEGLRRSMALLQRNEMRLRVVLDTAALGIAEFDRDDRILLANKHMLKLLSFPLADLLGKSIRDLTFHEDRPFCEDVIKKIHDGTLPLGDYETRFFRYNGTTVLVHAVVAPIRDFDGRHIGSIGTFEDITARKRYENEREHDKEELARSNRDLEQFANIVSHDLKEPLRMVESFGGLLNDRHADKLEGEARDYLEFITSGAKRMSNLINGLLEYSRVDRGPFVRSNANLKEIVDWVLSNLRVLIESTHAVIRVEPMPVVSGNSIQLVQLIQNLIENAVKYRKMDIKPEIDISCERQDHMWLVKIADNGLGIDPKYHARIFELFQQLHAEGEYPGVGLGLAVCKKIVERHGGRIWVESTQGNGSTFMFTLPDVPGQVDNTPIPN